MYIYTAKAVFRQTAVVGKLFAGSIYIDKLQIVNMQPPMNDIPLTDFKATVKFYRPSFANPIGEMVMREAFPAFNPDEKTFESETWKKIEAANVERMGRMSNGVPRKNGIEQNRVYRLPGILIRRRFAGDSTQSRGAYYSVCNDEYGNDKGTLKQELSTYMLPLINDQILVHDLVMPGDAEFLKQHVNAPTGIVIELLNSEETPNPIIIKLWEAKLIPEQITKPMLIFMPLSVEHFEVPRVLDLRQLAAQNWLAQFLPTGNEILKMPKAYKISIFPEMLPTLMYPDRGGNDITDSIGFLLRKMKVNGLVFPSARCNVLCEFHNGYLNDYKGWNFLDYRNSGDVFGDIRSRTDLNQWNLPDDFGNDIVCRVAPDDSPYAYSWRIEGLEENLKETLSHFLPAQTELISGSGIIAGKQNYSRNTFDSRFRNRLVD